MATRLNTHLDHSSCHCRSGCRRFDPRHSLQLLLLAHPMSYQGEDDGASFDAQWLPGGRRIVYATNSRRPEVISRIVVLDPDTGGQEEILRMTDLRLIAFLALSPDGKTLAFAASRVVGGADGGAPTSFALATMPASGGAMTELFQVKFPETITGLVAGLAFHSFRER